MTADADRRLANLKAHYERTYAKAATNSGKRFTLDGETVELSEFYVNNDFDPETVNRIGRMEAGDSITVGGGAGAAFTLKREA